MQTDEKNNFRVVLDTVKKLAMEEEIRVALRAVTCPIDCRANVESYGGTYAYVLICPNKPEFTVDEVRTIRKSLDEGGIAPGGDWKREFSDSQGIFFWRTTVRTEKNTIQITIHGVGTGKCKVVKKQKLVDYFEADCKAETAQQEQQIEGGVAQLIEVDGRVSPEEEGEL